MKLYTYALMTLFLLPISLYSMDAPDLTGQEDELTVRTMLASARLQLKQMEQQLAESRQTVQNFMLRNMELEKQCEALKGQSASDAPISYTMDPVSQENVQQQPNRSFLKSPRVQGTFIGMGLVLGGYAVYTFLKPIFFKS